jgi:hypothetical protein
MKIFFTMTWSKRVFAIFFGIVSITRSGLGAETNSEPALVQPEAPVETNTVTSNDLKSFKIIADRNIFNPNRSSRSTRRNTDSAPRKPVRIETFSMVGMISSDKGSFAFFDGSGSDYRKAAKVGDSVGSFKINEIGQDFVKLQGPEKEVTLGIGMQFRKQDEGEWQLIEKKDDSSSSSPSKSETNSAPSISDESDIVKKMMLKREQESK